MNSLELIQQERKEQIEKHGRTLDHDIKYNADKEMGKAASMLAVPEVPEFFITFPPKGWDKEVWKKMISKPYKQRLIIAGALILAELDRLAVKITNKAAKDDKV